MALFDTFAQGDTDYIANLNSNFTETESRLALLEAAINTQSFRNQQLLTDLWDRNGVIGNTACAPSDADPLVNVSTGSFINGGIRYTLSAGASVDFTGQPADTYFVVVDTAAVVSFVTSVGAGQTLLATVVWTGGGISSFTDSRVYLIDGNDYADCLDSAALGQSFSRLALRLENIETLLGAGPKIIEVTAKDFTAISGVGFGIDTVTGLVVINYSGSGGTVREAGLQFRVPDDYASGGQVRLVVAPDGTDTGTARFFITTRARDVGDTIDTADDTDEILDFVPAGVADDMERTSYLTPSTAVFSVGKWVTFKIKRIGNDAADTNNDAMNVLGIEFLYTKG